VCVVALGAGLAALPSAPSGVTLPLGLPWLGAHFRLDALSAFFLIVVISAGRREPVRDRPWPARA